MWTRKIANLFAPLFLAIIVSFVGCGTDDYPYYYESQRYYGSNLNYYSADWEDDWNYYNNWDYDFDGVPDYYDYCPYRAGSDYNYGCPYKQYYYTCSNCCSWLRTNSSRYYYYYSWFYLPENCYW